MSLETEGSSQATATTSEATPETTTSTGYSVTDPGYDSVEPVEDELAALKAENTKKKPSETSGDASDTDSDTEETAETPAGDDGENSQAAESDPFDVSDELLDRAVAVGYELDDIRDFKDAKSFEKELARVEKLQQRLQIVKGAKTAAEPEPEPESEEPNWDQMIEDGHDPDVIALQKSSWQRAAKAEAMVRQLQQAELQRAALAASDRFDDTLNALGDEYAPILGKGRIAELKKASPEIAANRQKVYSMMEILRIGYQQSGKPVPQESELVQQAFQASFVKQSQEIARNAIKSRIKNAGSQALSRPRSGSSRELPGPERALQKEREFWKNFNG